MSGRCCACDVKLSDFEMTRKYAESGTYVDLCNTCFRSIPNFPAVLERHDLQHGEDMEDSDIENDDIEGEK